MVLAHTIVAMVGDQIARVRCNTCNGEHVYRAPLSASEATAQKRRAERKGSAESAPAKSTPSEFEVLTKGKDLSRPSKYSPATKLALNDVIDHPSFGIGLVTELREGHKAHVAFSDGGRILVHSRQ
jgi:hypothetical protein